MAVRDIDHVENHADQNEQGRSGECQMRDAPRVHVVAGFKYDQEAERGHAVNATDGEAQQDARRQFFSSVQGLRELPAALVQNHQRQRIKQCHYRRNQSQGVAAHRDGWRAEQPHTASPSVGEREPSS